MERVRRRGELEKAKAVAVHGIHDMASKMPWDWVWGWIVADRTCGYQAQEEPSLLVLNRAQVDHVRATGEAPLPAAFQVG